MPTPASSFHEMTFDEWKQQAEKELSGPVFREWEHTQIPFYFTAQHRLTQVSRFDNRIGTSNMDSAVVRSWDNLVYINEDKPGNGNAHALNALMEGADGILFDNSGNHDPEQLLADILPEYVSLCFRKVSSGFAGGFRTWLDHSDATHSAIRGYLSPEDGDEFLPEDRLRLFREYPQVRLFPLHLDLPGENAFSGQLTSYLEDLAGLIDGLLARDIALEDIWQRLVLSADCGPLFFEEIARLKALRILTYKVFMAYGLRDIHPEQCFLHGISTVWTNDAYQPHANMLKNCTTALAAVLGGCTHLTLMPEDPDSELHARIARNVSLILREESHLDKVTDPAAGSYYIENLTRTLAENAWNSFTKANA